MQRFIFTKKIRSTSIFRKYVLLVRKKALRFACQRRADAYLRRTNGLAELARNTALLAVWIAAKRVLAAKARTERSLLKRIVDGGGLAKEIGEDVERTAEELVAKHRVGGLVRDLHPRHVVFARKIDKFEAVGDGRWLRCRRLLVGFHCV